MSNSPGDGWQDGARRPLISGWCCSWSCCCASKRETSVVSFVAVDSDGRHPVQSDLRFLLDGKVIKKRDEEEEK